MWRVPAIHRETIIVDTDDRHGELVSAGIESFSQVARPKTFREADEAVRCIRESADLELLFVDTALPDQGALAVIEAVFQLPSSPVVVAMGRGTDLTTDVFALAKVGVHAYLPKPLSEGQIHACLASAKTDLMPIRNLLRAYVGRFGLRDILAYVRRTLVAEALARTGGSRRSAARVLGVTRPAVQKYLREEGEHP